MASACRGNTSSIVGTLAVNATRRGSSMSSNIYQRQSRGMLLHVARHAIDGTVPAEAPAVDWLSLIHDAEAGHLTPLLDRFISAGRHCPSDAAIQLLRVLILRNGATHQARSRAIAAILDAFNSRGLEVVVLKGAALAWSIYPSPDLRPMSDLDLLIDRTAADAAQTELRSLGFHVDSGSRRFGRNAHHLPVTSRSEGGACINVELHVDALSRDSRASVALHNLTAPPRPFPLGGHTAYALGHTDALRHLAHHLLEPSPDGCVRLIGIIDLARYALRFHDDIDWPLVEARFPFITNALACLHHLVPLPVQLKRYAPLPSSVPPAGVGETMRPLRSIVGERRPVTAIAFELFNPPDWWMHAYYEVPPGQSLTTAHFLRHPSRVAHWFAQRMAGL